ncbi:hypothetical protein SAMN04489761_2497 [Tenacibaculum sp. MAR_2009_124]|nr:hypothetical protein SAMN04489761_2497 [Tenacibaculum sp. MAR_2009_124]
MKLLSYKIDEKLKLWKGGLSPILGDIGHIISGKEYYEFNLLRVSLETPK